MRLADFVLPWMTPRSLESTDRELLYSLLSYCRQFEQDLLDSTDLLADQGYVARKRSNWWLAIGLLLASFALVLIWLSWAT